MQVLWGNLQNGAVSREPVQPVCREPALAQVLDPADDLENEETSASEALYVGLFATACFAFCLLGLMYGAGWSCRTLFCGDADEGEGEGEGVPRGNSGASLQKVRPA